MESVDDHGIESHRVQETQRTNFQNQPPNSTRRNPNSTRRNPNIDIPNPMIRKMRGTQPIESQTKAYHDFAKQRYFSGHPDKSTTNGAPSLFKRYPENDGERNANSSKFIMKPNF